MRKQKVMKMGKGKQTGNKPAGNKQETKFTQEPQLTEKEKTKQELKQLGQDMTLMVDGVIYVAKGMLKIIVALFKMTVFALKFALDGLTMVFRQKPKQEVKSVKKKSRVQMIWDD